MANPVDGILSRIGHGKWNLLHILTSSLASGLLAPFALAGAFVVPRIGHVCRQSFNYDNNYLNGSAINNSSSCYYETKGEHGEILSRPCTEWDYDRSVFSRTITTDFNLVCEQGYIRALYMSLYMLGVLFASPFLGYVSDRFGRKKTFITGFLCFILISHISGWLPNIPALLVCRFLIGITHVPVVKISFVICMETCCPEYRSLAGILMYLPWTIYTVIYGGVAYLERDWRWLLTYASFLGLPLLPSLWFFDESPHWLAVKGRYGDALRVLKRAARWNKATLPPDEEILYLLKEHSTMVKPNQEEKEKENWLSVLKENVMNLFILFRTPRLRIIASVMHLGFFVIGMVYYGVAYSGGSFDIDIFSYMSLCGATELPSQTIMIPIVSRLGRKKPYIFCFLLTGVLLLCITGVPEAYQWVSVTLALLGRTALCGSSTIIYLYASELFPTEVRTRGITYSFMMSRAGSAVAPFITEYLAYSYKWAPSLLFGVFSIAAGLVAMPLWETLGTTLPDTIEFLENQSTSPEKRLSIEIKDSPSKYHDERKGELVPEEQICLRDES